MTTEREASAAYRWLALRRSAWRRRNRIIQAALSLFSVALLVFTVIGSVLHDLGNGSHIALIALIMSLTGLYMAAEEAYGLYFTPEEMLSLRDEDAKAALANCARHIFYSWLFILMLLPFTASFLPFQIRHRNAFAINDLQPFLYLLTIVVLCGEFLTYVTVSSPRAKPILRVISCLLMMMVVWLLTASFWQVLSDHFDLNTARTRLVMNAAAWLVPATTLMLSGFFYYLTDTYPARRTAIASLK